MATGYKIKCNFIYYILPYVYILLIIYFLLVRFPLSLAVVVVFVVVFLLFIEFYIDFSIVRVPIFDVDICITLSLMSMSVEGSLPSPKLSNTIQKLNTLSLLGIYYKFQRYGPIIKPDCFQHRNMPDKKSRNLSFPLVTLRHLPLLTFGHLLVPLDF